MLIMDINVHMSSLPFRKHIVISRVMDKLCLLSMEHRRFKTYANIVEVEKKWFSLFDGGWKCIEKTEISALTKEAETSSLSYTAALSARLESALALRSSLVFGFKNALDQQQLYVFPKDPLPFGNIYLLIKEVELTGDRLLFDFVAKLQLHSSILPEIAAPDHGKFIRTSCLIIC
jgi:hypothetical protein